MDTARKTAQLQIRVSPPEKAAIQRAARRAGLDMSSYVLTIVLPAVRETFQARAADCADPDTGQYGFAELTSFLGRLAGAELIPAVAEPPRMKLSRYAAAYIAALVESACVRRRVQVPAWVLVTAPLAEPHFGTDLRSLRLHLLVESPAAFRRRNIFVDSAIGDRV